MGKGGRSTGSALEESPRWTGGKQQVFGGDEKLTTALLAPARAARHGDRYEGEELQDAEAAGRAD
ncbi:MAG: hypothetical protein HOO96_38680 [Polyangiaceae bacterium]|nr:hypothetical protein [Polyangiaceae bacterium]